MSTSTATETPAQHGAKAHSDGGWGLVPVQTRSARFRSTDPEAFPAVTGRELEWKYTPVAALAPYFTEELDGGRYPFELTEDPAVTAEWVAADHALRGTAGKPEDRSSANAWHHTGEVLLVTVSGEAGQPVRLRRSELGDTRRAAHIIVHATANSKGVLVLDNTGSAALAENIEIVLDQGAQLTFVTLQKWEDDAVHLSSQFAEVGRDAVLRHFMVSLGGGIVRVNPTAHLAVQGADAELWGLYFSDAGQHLEQQVFIDHDAPSTRSRVNYKGALNGEGARAVWIGDVLIRRTADGTDSYEQNRNLVLSDGARADSVPNLEIETGEINGAGHASTTGRFDDEHLFYLMSRGIPEPVARRLVVRGFLNEIVQQIRIPELEEELLADLEEELARSAN